MLGSVVNKWTVIASSNPGPRGKSRWLCRCVCGTERAVSQDHLRSGATRDCGCGRRAKLMARIHSNTCINMEGEQWRAVPNFSLEASSNGRVRNAKSLHVYSQKLSSGYLRISYFRKLIKVHLLIAAAFMGSRPTGKVVNHIDGNKTNNKISNLEWCTQAENVRHAAKMGLMARPGSLNGATKLTESQVIAIRKSYASGVFRQQDLATQHGVSQRLISLIVRREVWTHV